MTTFSATKHAVAVVEADQQEIWAALVDPALMARLTKYVKRITADGDAWRWELSGLEILGRSIAPSFTERMVFEEPDRIEFHHDPPNRRETAGVERSLAPAPRRTPTAAPSWRPTCRSAWTCRCRGCRRRRSRGYDALGSRPMGDGFSADLLAHLGHRARPVTLLLARNRARG